MFRSVAEMTERFWSAYKRLILLSKYKAFQKQVIDTYAPYRHIVERYSETVERKVYPITEEYLKENPEVTEQNVALLKNAIELWRTASRVSDALSPILYHYSWHCFNSFFAYTFFGWEPLHSSSHGIEVRSETMNKNIEEITIRFRKEKKKKGETKGLFQRLIDTWVLIGTSPAFSAFLPVFEGDEIEFQPNELYLLSNSNHLRLARLLTFDPVKDYERKYWNTYGREKLLQNPPLGNSMNRPTNILKSYLIIFVASSIARYRPILWSSILLGENANQADFALSSREALHNFSTHFLVNLDFLIESIMKGKFELKRLP